MSRWELGVVLIFALCAASGCSSVPAYQRGQLAAPSMQPGYARSPAREHVHAVHEGAMGGNLEASSGCGCN
jgi:hypothetical protein